MKLGRFDKDNLDAQIEQKDITNCGMVNRRSFLASVGVAAGALALGLPEIAEADTSEITFPTSGTPNILVIMLDQLRYRELGQKNIGPGNYSGVLQTVLPNITALQSESIEFTNFYVAATSCTPSRATFMTGLYPPQTGMYITQGNGATPSLDPGFPTFATYLQSLPFPYQTAYFGKWHLSAEDPDNTSPSTNLSAYGFTVSADQNPSPDGFANEGMTGGSFSGVPHIDDSADWINDQQIVYNFASNLQALASTTTGPSQTPVPWAAVVSLVNPHDISNYPLYLINYCDISNRDENPPIQPYWAPQQPGTIPSWAAAGFTYPDVPTLYETFPFTSPSGLGATGCGSLSGGDLTSPGAISGITPASIPIPSNTTELQGSPKPALQQEFQQSLATVVGSVNTSSENNGQLDNGDWGLFLDVYYWLASCADQLIGNLSTPDEYLITGSDSSYAPCTILGQIAYLKGPNSPLSTALINQLKNTIVVFTSDHGEMGGAHSLQGKQACSYDEAINVPLFVRVPYFVQQGYGNIKRTQMVSSVDFFGLISGMAQPTYTTGSNPIPTWQSNCPWLASRLDMLACLQHGSYQSPRTITVSGVAEPYILHTYNEYFKCAPYPTSWQSSDPCHIVCLRTLTQKVVYYDVWATLNSPPQANFLPSLFNTAGPSYSTFWTTSNAEYYTYDSNGYGNETGNGFVALTSANSSTTQSQVQAAFKNVLTGEMQATLSGSLGSAQSSGIANFQDYLTPPTVTSVTSSTGGAINASSAPQSILVTASNVQEGPTVQVKLSNDSLPPVLIDDDDTPPNGSTPFSVTLTLSTSSTQYYLQVQNPSGVVSSAFQFTVS